MRPSQGRATGSIPVTRSKNFLFFNLASMGELESLPREFSLNRLDVQTKVAVIWVLSEPRFAEEIDNFDDDEKLANYALEKFVESHLAEKFAVLYDGEEVKKLLSDMKKNIQTEDDVEKIKSKKAFTGAMAQKIFEMIKSEEKSGT